MSGRLGCVIPAAGQGSRLEPHSLGIQKPLLLMGTNDGRVIDSALHVAREADEAFVIAPYINQQADLLEEYVCAHSDAQTIRDPLRLGAASLIHFSEVLFERDPDGHTIIIPADHVIEGLEVDAFYGQHLEKERAITVLGVPIKPYGDFIRSRNDFVSSINTTSISSRHSSAGVYIVKNRLVLDWVAHEIAQGWDYEARSFLDNVVRPSVTEHEVAVYALPDQAYWDDVGTLSRYYRNNMRLSNGENVVSQSASMHRGACVTSCVILGNVEVPEGAIIHGAIVSGRKAIEHITQVV